jgi:hypothetical protein
VCTCTERATGLKLAAKVIKKQTPKDKVVGEVFSEWASLSLSLSLCFVFSRQGFSV